MKKNNDKNIKELENENNILKENLSNLKIKNDENDNLLQKNRNYIKNLVIKF